MIAHGHPWVYADALVPPIPAPGTPARLLDQRGRFLAMGLCERGAIGLRVLSRDPKAQIGQDLFAARVDEALELRRHLDLADTSAYRLIHGEADRLAGLVCDRYNEHAVIRFDGQALYAHRELIYRVLVPRLKGLGIDHLHELSGRGPTRSLKQIVGQAPSAPICVQEHGMKLVVDLAKGQKTGMFLDHRPSRRQLRHLCTRILREDSGQELRVLNLYGYTGGFSLAAGLGGATHVTTVDISAPALEMARQSWEANGLCAQRHRIYAGKAEHFLQEEGSYHIVVADPPSFAPSEKAKSKALSAYRAMHKAALSRVRPGGYYLTASCSSHIDRATFEGTLVQAAHGAKVSLQVLSRWGAGADHPVLMGFGAGDYLCAVLTKVRARQSG